jgi:hypothetical protein
MTAQATLWVQNEQLAITLAQGLRHPGTIDLQAVARHEMHLAMVFEECSEV